MRLNLKDRVVPKITYSTIAKEIKEFAESYDWERTLKEITAKSSVSEIENRLLENLKH